MKSFPGIIQLKRHIECSTKIPYDFPDYLGISNNGTLVTLTVVPVTVVPVTVVPVAEVFVVPVTVVGVDILPI